MSYQYVCEPCRQALGLPAERSYLNKIRREAGGFSSSGTPAKSPVQVLRRDPSGKPLVLVIQRAAVREAFPAGCVCACRMSGHDPMLCTGAEQHKVGGRPGSGAVDELAQKAGMEPIPEMVLAVHEGCQVLVAWFLALRLGSSEEDCARLESDELPRLRYQEQLRMLRDILREEQPELAGLKTYCDIVPNLRKLAGFRNKIAHSRPVNGDPFTRARRVNASNVRIHVTREELAEYLDLAMQLQSQLSLLPLHWNVRRAA